MIYSCGKRLFRHHNLSLLLPSYIAVSIRELENILFSAIVTSSNSSNIDSSQNINMVIDLLENLFDIGENYDKVRDRSLEMSAYKPRFPSISSSKYDEEYHIQVKRESNRIVEDEPVNSIGSICIEYVT